MTTAPPAVRESRTLVTRQKVLDYLNAFGLTSQLLPHEAEQFVALAQEFQLNPFKREIHVVPYGEGAYRRLSIVVGYEVYLKRAERTGQLDGWKAWTEGEGPQLKAVVEIYRKDWDHPFIHEVYWTEAVQTRKDGQTTSFWSRMPKFQLRKVAISQGFRLAFPDELGGLPYEAAELSVEIPSTPEEPPAPESAPQTLPEHSQVPAGASSSASGEPQTLSSAVFELDDYIARHASHFDSKHIAWIKAQVDKAGTVEKAVGMLRYAKKVVRESSQTLRQERERAFRKPAQAADLEPVPTY